MLSEPWVAAVMGLTVTSFTCKLTHALMLVPAEEPLAPLVRLAGRLPKHKRTLSGIPSYL